MKNKQLVLVSIALIVFASLSRLVSHPMNFTPITALILFSVFAFEGKWKIIVPVMAIVLSDLVLELNSGIGFHGGTWLVYSGYALIGIIGYLLIKNASAIRLLSSSILGSVSFFLLTNFAFFYPVAVSGKENYGYTHDLMGIAASYTAGIPFFRNMLVGDLVYTAVLFGSYFVVKRLVFHTSMAK
jgi:hypothetical protein